MQTALKVGAGIFNRIASRRIFKKAHVHITREPTEYYRAISGKSHPETRRAENPALTFFNTAINVHGRAGFITCRKDTGEDVGGLFPSG
jgi:hypothetical protein